MHMQKIVDAPARAEILSSDIRIISETVRYNHPHEKQKIALCCPPDQEENSLTTQMAPTLVFGHSSLPTKQAMVHLIYFMSPSIITMIIEIQLPTLWMANTSMTPAFLHSLKDF